MIEEKNAGRPFGTKKVDPAKATEQKATFIVSKVLLNKIKLLVQTESYSTGEQLKKSKW